MRLRSYNNTTRLLLKKKKEKKRRREFHKKTRTHPSSDQIRSYQMPNVMHQDWVAQKLGAPLGDVSESHC